MPSETITQRANWRYLNDGEFHARVAQAVATLERDAGVWLDTHDRSLATQAVTVALYMAELPSQILVGVSKLENQ